MGQIGIVFLFVLIFGGIMANDRTHDDHGGSHHSPVSQMC